jgi:UDP-N-acetylglucosamine--N-acetylmuramyl-(pentapeptide) pyrophosphoryl-undecaprenol N-acetylglucosamine transferase
MATIMMAGGGTGGHVVPALAVAHELRARGHQCVFVGTRNGFEAKLVPAENFPLEFIEIGGLKRVGALRTVRTLLQLPLSIVKVLSLMRKHKPRTVFSMGGYAAGPVVLAALWKRLPLIVMEPNAVPGLTNRQVGRFVKRALLGFPQASRFFPPGKSEVTGLPVRPEFFAIPPKPREPKLTILITGGSQGSRTLNQAAAGSWRYFKENQVPVRFIHQTGSAAYEGLARKFSESGMEGEMVPFIEDMPAAFRKADLVICRAGAGAVAELAAAGKPSVLVPLPHASDEHQLRNAEAFAHAGAAQLVLDQEMDGGRLFEEVRKLRPQPDLLTRMGERARSFAHPDAARRAAEVVESTLPVDIERESRNNTY